MSKNFFSIGECALTRSRELEKWTSRIDILREDSTLTAISRGEKALDAAEKAAAP
jgi:hypothetical protein